MVGFVIKRDLCKWGWFIFDVVLWVEVIWLWEDVGIVMYLGDIDND